MAPVELKLKGTHTLHHIGNGGLSFVLLRVSQL